MDTTGLHVTADVWLQEWPEPATLEKLIKAGLKEAKMTVLDTNMHSFTPDAFTFLALLAESHFSMHTFPERNFLAMDCYTCGDEGNPLDCIAAILRKLKVADAKIKIGERG